MNCCGSIPCKYYCFICLKYCDIDHDIKMCTCLKLTCPETRCDNLCLICHTTKMFNQLSTTSDYHNEAQY